LQIQYSNDTLTIDGRTHVLDRRILDAASYGERVFVVFDYMAYPAHRPARNLVALDRNAGLLWTVADNPADTPAAGYTCIDSVSPLLVGNFAGYQCTIDAVSGALLKSQFTK
jgi:hypothetical protein